MTIDKSRASDTLTHPHEDMDRVVGWIDRLGYTRCLSCAKDKVAPPLTAIRAEAVRWFDETCHDCGQSLPSVHDIVEVVVVLDDGAIAVYSLPTGWTLGDVLYRRAMYRVSSFRYPFVAANGDTAWLPMSEIPNLLVFKFEGEIPPV